MERGALERAPAGQLPDVRQGFVPGVNLAGLFAEATHNNVANAALIGSLPPVLIVPCGAGVFPECIAPRALVFAVVAFGGVALVLFQHTGDGDAPLQGNAFGVVALLLLVGYVISTRRFRREMDVTTFMANAAAPL